MNKLLKAIITNFKGLKERTFEFDPKQTSFAGTNASFKTTLFDAVMWNPTGKNHLGESDFEIKTREGDEIRHHLHHSVELEFENFSTKRDYYEIWKTKRGTTEKKLTVTRQIILSTAKMVWDLLNAKRKANSPTSWLNSLAGKTMFRFFF
jgi:recombinational DNA repair ATPase RecF